MATRYKVGDFVEWKEFYGKRTERGNIDSVDYQSGLMSIWTGTFPNSGGGCKVSISARRVGGRWRVYRSHEGYLERMRRVPAGRR